MILWRMFSLNSVGHMETTPTQSTFSTLRMLTTLYLVSQVKLYLRNQMCVWREQCHSISLLPDHFKRVENRHFLDFRLSVCMCVDEYYMYHVWTNLFSITSSKHYLFIIIHLAKVDTTIVFLALSNQNERNFHFIFKVACCHWLNINYNFINIFQFIIFGNK